MTRVVTLLLVALIPTFTFALAEDQSRTKSEESDSVDVEPPILKQNLSSGPSAPETPGDAIARSEKKLEQAKQEAKGVERLCKTGVLSKVEMEQRLLKVMQCEAELASARLAEAKGKVAELESYVASDQNAKDQLATAKGVLKQVSEAAEAAKAKRERAELESAEGNVRRQQQLLKVGLAAKSDVDQAEENLAEPKRRRVNED
jgi:multidrug resistance efflux pump